MYRVLLILIFSSVFSLGECRPPTLTPRDTRVKIEEILRAHVSYQKLTPELAKRTLLNFLEELDSSKTYFLAPEIAQWTDPSEELLDRVLHGIKKEDFSIFYEICEQFSLAAARRNDIENSLPYDCFVEGVNPNEFKDMTWISTQEELENRISRIRSLQLETAKKLNQESCDQFLQRLNKRRLNRQEELDPSDKTEKQRVVLATVLKSVSSSLDSQTAYFTPSEANQFMIQVQQRLFGIGAQLRDDLSGFTIMRLLEGGPASLDNKLKVGDRIIAVDHEPVVGLDIIEAVELIRGQQGSPVLLTILRTSGEESKRQEEKLDIEMVRGEVVLKETRLETRHEPYGDGIIAYLHLYSFYQDSTTSSAQDLAVALEDLKENYHLKGVVLDLRNNAGGLLPQAVSVTGLFIGKGVVVSVKDNSGMVQHLRNLEEKVVWDGPLIVLINPASASATEIVAQTLQDYGRAIVVGDEHSYGKGTFQTFTLEANHFGKVNPKGEYKVTRGRYYTVSGKSPQLSGVASDIIVPGLLAKMEIGECHSKYPLDNEEIAPSFEDHFSDIPPAHRFQFARLYKNNLQTILTQYRPLIPLLVKNSADRISQSHLYQKFLKELEKKDLSMEFVENFNQFDLQLYETMNVMKDFIALLDKHTMNDLPLPAAAGG